MQENILLFFRSLSSPFLDQVVEIITMFGEETIIITFVVLIFWCIDKRKGEAICSSLLFSIITAGFLKAIVKSPRPFKVLDNFEGKRVSTATGYSFPSGHTTTSASFYSGLGISFRKKGITITAAILIALVALSRLYLGVHWPIDVAFGLILGIIMSFVFVPKMYKLFSSPTALKRFSIVFASITGVISILLALLLTFNIGDKVAWTDLYKVLALSSGGFYGLLLEERNSFTIGGNFWKRALQFVVGMIGIVLVMACKAILPVFEIFGFIRYFITGLWAFGLYPLLGKKIKLFL